MMIVVPAVAEHRNGQEEVVAAVVIATVGSGPEPMTERVHAPDRMVSESNADQSAPEQSIECPARSTDQPVAQSRRNRQSKKDPNKIEPVDSHQHAILHQLGNVKDPIIHLRAE